MMATENKFKVLKGEKVEEEGDKKLEESQGNK